MADTYNPGLLRSPIVLVAMVFTEAIIVVLSVRFVGSEASEVLGS